MQLFFESQLAITDIKGKLYFFQEQPEVLPKQVISPDRTSDGHGVAVGTVIHDGGRYRMWYLALPDPNDREPKKMVAYAESDNGLTWTKPDLDVVNTKSFKNNYCNLGLDSPTVFIDPDSPSSHRYRATGDGAGGYYTAHSTDGLYWELDSPKPRWYSGDVINSIYHPHQKRGICAMKFVRRMNGINRRAIWQAELKNGQWGEPVCALVPDEFDDVAAIARGCNSTDYYGMGMMPAGSATVGFLCNFRHTLPLSMSPEHYAIFGISDITLVYQAQPGDRWLHTPGRKSFISCGSQDWNKGWLQPCSSVVEAGNYHFLYLNGHVFEHAWNLDVTWKGNEKWTKFVNRHYKSGAGIARWQKWRMFGYYASPEGVIDVELGEIEQPSELVLNYKSELEGSIRVQIFEREGRYDTGNIINRSNMDDVVPLTGDNIAEIVKWKDGTTIQPAPGKRIVARLTMENSRVYAWEVRPLK